MASLELESVPRSTSALPPLRIGNIDIGFPVVQAALSGYSDWAMRVIARRLGAPYTLCEVLLDQFVITAGHSKKHRRLQVTDEEHPVGGQLMGAESRRFRPRGAATGGGGLRRDRHQLRLPGEKSAGPLPRRLFARAGRHGAGNCFHACATPCRSIFRSR